MRKKCKVKDCPKYPRKGRVYCAKCRVKRKLKGVRRKRRHVKGRTKKSDIKRMVLESPVLTKLGNKLFKKLGRFI